MGWPWLSLASLCAAAGAVTAALLIYEQINCYFRRKRVDGSPLPGPGLVVPLIGGLAKMIWSPVRFWENQRLFATNGLSSNYLAGKFMVFSTNTDVNRFVMNNTGKNAFSFVLHPNAGWILGPTNITFMHGQEHKALRNSFLSLFQPSSLGKYLELQEAKIHQHLDSWLQNIADKPTEIRTFVRDLNIETSQTVFLGSYVADPVAFNQHYLNITNGFMVPPIPLPGTGLWKAVQSRKAVVQIMTDCVVLSKAAMLVDGATPGCLLDFWCQRINSDIADAIAAGEAPPPHTGSHQMAETLLDFLFAAQDASTASLCWILTLMADHPQILARVREEQLAARPNGETVSFDTLAKLPFTRQVVMETLRYRPPAMMTPHIAHSDINITSEYKITKGSLVIPSIWSSCTNSFTNGHEFDPDRYGPGRDDTMREHAKGFLVFGCGLHSCVGQKYAINHLICFLSVVSTRLNWERTYSAGSGGVGYYPTLYPFDSVLTITDRATSMQANLTPSSQPAYNPSVQACDE